MKLRRLLAACTLAVIGMGSLAPALAQSSDSPYPPSVGNARLNRSRACQGQCVQFSGDGFAPNSDVVVTDNGRRVGTARTNPRGSFSFRYCFADDAAVGRHELKGTGRESDGRTRTVTAVVEVCRKVSGSGLPRTGDNSTMPALMMGFILVAAGTMTVFLTRRRRRRAPAR